MKILRKNRLGMILAEALMSVTMLATGSIIVGNVIHSTVTSTVTSKNYMIAQNLATEGIEAVKNIRDTNWLMEPNDKNCWLRKNPSVDGDCFGDMASVSAYYIAVKQSNGEWMLTSNNSSGSPLSKELDLASPVHADLAIYQLYINDADQYENIVSSKPSIFYRGLTFTSIDSNNNQAIVRVRVQWKEGAAVRKLERTEIIYNSL